MIYHVSLTVGKVFVTGEGSSPQAARHHAASQALQQLNSENSSVQTTCIEGRDFPIIIIYYLLLL